MNSTIINAVIIVVMLILIFLLLKLIFSAIGKLKDEGLSFLKRLFIILGVIGIFCAWQYPLETEMFIAFIWGLTKYLTNQIFKS